MIVDTHGHFQDGDSIIYNKHVDIEEMLTVLDMYSINTMWLSSTSALSGCYQEANLRQYHATKAYPSRFVNFYVVNPNYPDNLEADLRRSIEDRGFRGIKMHPWCGAFPVNHHVTHRVMEIAIEYDMPVLFHDGTPPWSETLQVASLADYYPEAKIIIGHSGLFDAYRSAVQACNTHENIWLCICGPCIGDASAIIQQSRKDRLLYGSDYAASDSHRIIDERLKVIHLACSDERIKNDIFSTNPMKLIPN